MKPATAFSLLLFLLIMIKCLNKSSCLAAALQCPHHCSCIDVADVSCNISTFVDWDHMCKELKDYAVQYPKLNLKLTGNLSSVSENLGCLPDLGYLDVSKTYLDVQENTFQDLHVKSLNLSSNGIRDLPGGAFVGLHSLLELDLSNNSIETLNSETFRGLESLISLRAGLNNLSSLSAEAFMHVPYLEHLDLEHNVLHEFSLPRVSLLANIRTLNLHGNLLSMLTVASNGTGLSILKELSSLDISANPLECSCMLGNLFNLLPNLKMTLENPAETVCMSPESLEGRGIETVDTADLQCSMPSNIISYPSSQKSVLPTSSVTLECKAEGYPKPSILWITPWNDKFVNGSKLRLHNQDMLSFRDEKFYTSMKYAEPNVFLTSTLHLTADDDLVISKFRGSMAGNFTCIAFNAAGNASAEISLTVYSELKSVYVFSLILGGYCASGFLIFGFIVGFIKMVVVWLRRKLYFIIPMFSKSTSNCSPEDDLSNSFPGYAFGSKPDSDSGSSCSQPGNSSSPLIVHTKVLGDLGLPDIPESPDDAHSPGSWRPYSIFESLEEAKGRLRHGMGRKMEQMRKNVQSIKESGSVYVHNIVESGSSAASRMKAGVVMGVETVKYHVQSFKELCGTGDMGTQTISMVSVETDVDSSQQKEVIKQITYV